MARRHHREWAPDATDRALAAALGAPAAFLPVDGGWATVQGSVLELALAVWERFPGRAHAILRARIRTTAPLSPVDLAAVAVVARRATAVLGEAGLVDLACEDLGPWLERARVRVRQAAFDPGVSELPADRFGFVEGLVPDGAAGPMVARDRPVVAVLAGPDGGVRWAARNAGGANRVLHAECCLVLGYVERHGLIPAGSTVLTSLQPCRMCAALLVAHAAGPIRVRYSRPDPGRLARGTSLQAAGWEAGL